MSDPQGHPVPQSPSTDTEPDVAEPVDPFDMTSASYSPVPLDHPAPQNPAMPGRDPTRETFRRDEDAALDAEVEAALGGATMEELMAQSSAPDAALQDRLRGTQAGTVVSIDQSKGEMMVDLGGKHQAVVPTMQFDPLPSMGEFIEVDIERYDTNEGIYRANRKGAARRITGWDELQPGQVIEATCTGMNKGGLECRVGPTAIRAFMPAGQVDVGFHKDISIFIGQKFPAKITKVDRAARNLVLSRRAVIESERKEAKARLSKELAEGQVLKGTVKSVKDFGAFVDIGGMDGLLHVSQLTHRRMARAQDFVEEGQEVEVRIDSFDREQGKISLSLSHTPPNPWESAEIRYAPGTEVTGRVTRVENFGAFIEVEEGIEALLPTSEMSWSRIRHPSEMLNVGDATRAQVINVDPKARKLTLSLKQIGGDPWQEAAGKYTAGTVHPAKITRVAEFGAFAELEPGIEGLIHISELANTRVRRTEDVVQLGQEVQARVLQVEPAKRRIRLSIRPRDERAEAAAAVDMQQREQQKKQRQKRLEKKPLKGGLDF
jgi:small subunit ribosomal protein S1